MSLEKRSPAYKTECTHLSHPVKSSKEIPFSEIKGVIVTSNIMQDWCQERQAVDYLMYVMEAISHHPLLCRCMH